MSGAVGIQRGLEQWQESGRRLLDLLDGPLARPLGQRFFEYRGVQESRPIRTRFTPVDML